MKTTIDIPEKVLKEAIRHSGASTKREAVLAALDEYNRRKRAAEVVRHFGTFENFMTLEELMELRKSD